MTRSRWKQRFEGNQRVDLPDFLKMQKQIIADFDLLVKTFIDSSLAPRVIKRYQEGVHTSGVFKIARDAERAVIDANKNWDIVSAEGVGATFDVPVNPNTNVFISVCLNIYNTDLQTRAFWDTDISTTGAEFFDEINIAEVMEEMFQATTTPPVQSQGWIPLWSASVDGTGLITNVQRIDDLLWKPRNTSLPSVRSNVYESIKDLRTLIDFIGAITSEIKGSGQKMEDIPWSSLKLLREYQNLFIHGGGEISWGRADVDVLRFTSKLFISIAGRSTIYELGQNANNDFEVAEGECLYVDIPEVATPVLTINQCLLKDVPINPLSVGSSPRICVLFYRKDNVIHGSMEIPDLESGETGEIGQHISQNIRDRLGLLSDTEFKPYPSAAVINATDDYATAIGKHDAAIAQILSENAREFDLVRVSPTVYRCNEIEWNPENDVFDVVIFRNNVKRTQGENRDFIKISSNEVEFYEEIEDGEEIRVRQERSGAPSTGSADFVNIPVSLQPDTNGARNIGSVTRAWGALFLKDKTTAQVYELSIDNGVLVTIPVP